MILSGNLFAQQVAVDSKGKDIFDFYKAKSLSIPISNSNNSFQVTGTANIGRGIQYFVSAIPNDSIHISTVNGKQIYPHIDSLKFTVSKSNAVNWTIGVSNLGKNLARISTFHPTYIIGIGYANTLDAFNNWSNIETLSNKLLHPSTFNVNIYAKFDNVIIYDTLVKDQSRKHPITAGALIGYTVFPSKWIAFSASLNYERNWNTSNLKTFQKNNPYYTNTDIISLGDFVGRLGDLKKQNFFRERLSIPIFFPPFHIFHSEQVLPPVIIPYYCNFGNANTQFSHQVGLFFSILSKSHHENNSTISPGAGVGVDWIKSSNGWSSANIFVAGSVDIFTFFAHTKGKKS